MMRGPSYDDNYIARKMSALHTGPTFLPPSRSPVGGYLQEVYPSSIVDEVLENATTSTSSTEQTHHHLPSARTQLILNRCSMSQPRCYIPPPPRMMPRVAPPPTFYDYDYGYGGGYGGYGGYGAYPSYYSSYYPPAPLPRYRAYSYDPYLDDDYDYNYVPRYRPGRLSDTLVELEKEKLRRSLSPTRVISTTTPVPHTTDYLARHFSPGMLQDQVDKMRVKLKSMAFSLDPSGPVPEIITPDLSRRVDSRDLQKKYTSALEFEDLPKLGTRRHHYYPEDEHMKDNLRIKCLSHYKTTQTQAEYWKPKGFYGDEVSKYSLPNYTSRYATPKSDSLKWEEPDTVYGRTTDKKPFSKVETGSSFFSTYGYTNRMKDTIADKVRDYYYYGDETIKTAEVEDDDAKKERRKKKKSKERDDVLAIESTPASEPSPAAASAPPPAASAEITEPQVSSALEPTSAPAAAEIDSELDEKERKRLEKKKRKAEREAAAKAAMEAELEALAVAELELARLEAESAAMKPPAPEAKASEKSAGKCESPIEAPCDVLPECIPNEFESEPTFLSNENVVDESFQGVAEELKEQDQVFQDLSAEQVASDEPVEFDWAQDDHRVIEETLVESEAHGVPYEEIPEPPQSDEVSQVPIFRQEFRFDNDAVNEPVIPESTSEVPTSYEEPIEAAEPHTDVGHEDIQLIGVDDITDQPILEEQQHHSEEVEEVVVAAAEGDAEAAGETTTATEDEAFEYVLSTDGE